MLCARLRCKMAARDATGLKRSEDILVALESAGGYKVTDEDGHDVEFGSLFQTNKAIIIFVRVGLHHNVCTIYVLYGEYTIYGVHNEGFH